jgi:MFS family permease
MMRYSINRDFSILLGGQLVSQIGDKFYMLALSFWVLETTGSPAKMGTVLAAALIPSLLLGFVSGAFIDRYNRKRIIVGTDLLRGLIVSGVVLLYYFDMLGFHMIILSQVLLSINAAFFDPAIPAVIPQLVTADELTRANSKHQFVQGISNIIGPALGGIAVASFGYLCVFIVNALSFFISGFIEMLMRLPDSPAARPKVKIVRDIQTGYRYIFSNRILLIILVMVGAIHFFVGSIEVVMPVAASTISGNGARNLGFFQTAFGLGAVTMAMILSVKAFSGKESKVLFGSVFLLGILFIAAALPASLSSKSAWPFLPIFFLNGCLIISAGTAFKSLLQRKADPRMIGRVFGVAGSVGNGSIPAAMIVFGFLMDRFSYSHLLFISGLVLLPLSWTAYTIYKGAAYGQKSVQTVRDPSQDREGANRCTN